MWTMGFRSQAAQANRLFEFSDECYVKAESTFALGATWDGAFRYLDLTALSLAIRPGKIDENPGTKLSIHINSFSIQSRSWLLQTAMMKMVYTKGQNNKHQIIKTYMGF